MSRLLTSVLLLLVATTVASAADYVTQRLSTLPARVVTDIVELEARPSLSNLDGVWEMTQGGGKMAIIPINDADPSQGFMLVVLNSSDRTILPGTVMGIALNAAKKGSFDAAIYSGSSDGKMTNPKRFTLTLNGENHLSIVPVKNRLKVNLRNLLPYMFRISVTRQNNRSDELDGAVRVGVTSGKPLNPRIL